jgi:hypothetical protein
MQGNIFLESDVRIRPAVLTMNGNRGVSPRCGAFPHVTPPGKEHTAI